MDDHFVFSVQTHVERVNAYFQERLYGLLKEIEGGSEPDLRPYCSDCPLAPSKLN
jgi:hypothetical protein